MTGIGEFGQKNQSEIHLGQNFSFLISQERLVPLYQDINHLQYNLSKAVIQKEDKKGFSKPIIA